MRLTLFYVYSVLCKLVTEGNSNITSGFHYKTVGVNVVAATLAGFAGCTASKNLFKRNGLRDGIIDGDHFAAFTVKQSIYRKRT